MPRQIATIAPMLSDLSALAEKTDALVAVVDQLRQENTRLRNQIAQLSNDQRGLQDRLNAAATKLQGLLDQLPQEP
ncbi:MAG: hypothetical protein RLZZ281_1023 [Pseudomonadota bacterium]|jgi:FtsZ-binding cell division protein ZapB